MVLPILLLIVILLAYANEANDTFKGVATLISHSQLRRILRLNGETAMSQTCTA